MYWENSGRENTAATVKAALERARELDIEHIVVASNTGETAKLFLDQGVKVVCVSHHVGFREPGDDEMPARAREFFREKGIPVLTATHLLAGIGRAVTQDHGGQSGANGCPYPACWVGDKGLCGSGGHVEELPGDHRRWGNQPGYLVITRPTAAGFDTKITDHLQTIWLRPGRWPLTFQKEI